MDQFGRHVGKCAERHIVLEERDDFGQHLVRMRPGIRDARKSDSSNLPGIKVIDFCDTRIESLRARANERFDDASLFFQRVTFEDVHVT